MSSSTHQSWSDASVWDSRPAPNPLPEPTACLDFLVAAATSGVQQYVYLDLINGFDAPLPALRPIDVAGAGATSVVHIGKTRYGRLVALKMDRETSQPLSRIEPAHFVQYLSLLAKELRILRHDRLKRNPHILDLLGFGLEEHGSSLSCFLAEEYSDLGDLRSFLQSRSPLSNHQLLVFCLGIARYVLLGAFHRFVGMQYESQDVFLAQTKEVLPLSMLPDFVS